MAECSKSDYVGCIYKAVPICSIPLYCSVSIRCCLNCINASHRRQLCASHIACKSLLCLERNGLLLCRIFIQGLCVNHWCFAGALFKACVDGDAAYVELLINNGMSPSTCDYNQRTPLHLAASNGHTHIVHFLCNQTVRSYACFLAH